MHPLDQFKISSIFNFFGFKLVSIAIFLTLTLFVINFLFKISRLKKSTDIDIIISSNKTLVANILKENLPLYVQTYFAIIFFLFLNIFLNNSVGLLPYAFTTTSSVMVTANLSLMHFIGINIIGINIYGWELVNLFLPGDSPLWISIFLVAIEGVSYIARVLSLSIRLFANMMSGHALLKILNGFTARLNAALPGAVLLPWIIVTIIFVLELLISFLQAYVFVVLIVIYLYDVHFIH